MLKLEFKDESDESPVLWVVTLECKLTESGFWGYFRCNLTELLWQCFNIVCCLDTVHFKKINYFISRTKVFNFTAFAFSVL